MLCPGQLLHINKGRIHAFRKQTTDVLPRFDCHANLRAMEPPSKHDICLSVAWDWQYRGVTCEGINREIVASLECSYYNRVNKKLSLAIPETALLMMAQDLTAANPSVCNNANSMGNPNINLLPSSANLQHQQRFEPSRQDILRGILPSLHFVVNQHCKFEQEAKSFKNEEEHGPCIQQSKTPWPNCSQDPEHATVEPYGNFFCRFCRCELSNLYFRCEGCEKILQKHLNICWSCFEKRIFATTIQMHPKGSEKAALNHVGKPRYCPPRACGKCPCNEGTACLNCQCCPCSCQCHQHFAINCRFFTMDCEKQLLQKVEQEVGNIPCQYVEETKRRLELMSEYSLTHNDTARDTTSTDKVPYTGIRKVKNAPKQKNNQEQWQSK